MDRRRLPPNIPAYAPNDLTSTLPMNTGNPTRSDTRSPGHAKRKQTLLTLLDALNELSNQGLDHDSRDGTTLLDDEQEGPSTDEQVQSKGAEAFNRFQRRVQQLDKELQNFANAVRQLGSSVGILSSSFHLRQRLMQVLFLFRENAADLFPRKIQREQRELYMHDEVKKRIRRTQSRRRKEKVPPTRPIVQDNLTLECLPAELELLAKDVTTFLECLNEFPEFTDEAVNASILAFEGDLKYWASCMKEFEGQFRYPAVERYVHDLSSEMGDHIDAITSTIGVFVEVGVPTIRFAQKHAATNLLNLSTVATFFSAVTATTIQFSFDKVQGPLQTAVNAFWFSSLVFSIASAVNSLLGLTWKQAMYRSPRHRVPWWVLIWIKRSPLIFLVVSVAAFSVGLVLFTWASDQDLTTCVVTTVFTGFSSFGLIAVSAWFAFERVTYSRHKGKRWLADILSDLNADIRRYTGLEWAEETLPRHAQRARRWSGSQASRVAQRSTSFVQASSRALTGLSTTLGKSEETANGDEGTLPIASPIRDSATSPTRTAAPHRLSEATSIRIDSPTPMITPPLSGPSTPPATTVNDADPLAAAGRTTPRGRFASAVRSVIMLQNASPLAPTRKSSGLSAVVGTLDKNPRTTINRRDSTEPFTAAKLQRLIMLSHTLKHVETTETLPAHQALVRHLQFSPNGKWLATCSWDRTSVLFRVGSNGEPFTPHRTLAHPQGFVHQVAWAPKGGHLLTKLHRGVKIWTEDGVCIRTIERHRTVQSVTWLPSAKEFLSVEGSEVNRVDLTGKVLDSYRLPRLALHDVAVTPDEERMLGVATLIESPDGLQPHKARKEKRIVVYNMAEKAIENQVPVLHNVRDITIASKGHLALVSYEDKAPPQLWRLDRVNDDVRLSLRHTYMPNQDVDFAGPSYFGGKEDQLILCAGKNGHIHIWDRESATLLHDIRAPDGDLTGIAWNTAYETPMFATGSHDGAVKIWTSPLHQPVIESRSQSGEHSRTESPVPMGGPNVFVDSPMFGGFDGQVSRNVSMRETPMRDREGNFVRERPQGRDRATTVSFTRQNDDTRL